MVSPLGQGSPMPNSRAHRGARSHLTFRTEGGPPEIPEGRQPELAGLRRADCGQSCRRCLQLHPAHPLPNGGFEGECLIAG
jgi:hypothetical protein